VPDNTPEIRVLSSIGEVCGPMRLNPEQLADRYYYDDLQYRKLSRIAVDALEEGYDGLVVEVLTCQNVRGPE
jgi:hypothetical protein